MPNLIRTKKGEWRVSYIKGRETKNKTFLSVEEAADLMFALGVSHDAIDDAIIAIYTCEYPADLTVAALFDANGCFSHLDAA